MALGRVQSTRYFGNGASSMFARQDFYEKRVVEEKGRNTMDEDKVLCLLLEMFPGISLECLAVAYARAEGDPNVAADILSKELPENSPSHEKVEEPPGWQATNSSPANYDYEEQPVSSVDTVRKAEKEVEKEEWQWQSEKDFMDEYTGKFGLFSDTSKAQIVKVWDDRSNIKSETNQLKNGHGDFSGASVWRDTPALVGNDSNLGNNLGNYKAPEPQPSMDPPPVPSVQLVKPESNGDRSEDDGYPSLERRSKKLSAAAPVYEFQGLPARSYFPVGAISPSIKLSASAGSVSNLRQRRNEMGSGNSNGNGGSGGFVGMSTAREMELDDGLYSGKLKKKKQQAGNGKDRVISESEDITNRESAEEFLHSMFGLEIGLGVVRDVLGHFAGDTTQAMDTLLNMVSGFDEISSDGKISGTSPPAAGIQDGEEVIELAGNSHTLERLTLDSSESGSELSVHPDDEADSKDSNDLLVQLHASFPTVERGFLDEVLQASGSYEGAVEILKESGLKPIGKQVLQPKLKPADVLQALFGKDGKAQEVVRVSTERTEPKVLKETWTVVASKARVRRSPDVEAKVELAITEGNGECEYVRQRTTANEHWATMKRYMHEAAAAYGRGERAHAGVLSEKGAKFKLLAQEASSRASHNIFNVQNRDIENNITIDLHAQHVQESLKLLKLHLRSLSQIQSVHRLTIITGQGSHSSGGRAKIKPAGCFEMGGSGHRQLCAYQAGKLTKYLQTQQIPWKEVNAGCILVNMAHVRSLMSSQGSESSSDHDN